jgi:hypothetical protein
VPYIQVEAIVVRQKRVLAKNVWYKVETAVNSAEPLFQLEFAAVLLYRVLCEATGRFAFEMRGLATGDEGLSFYIKPADGFQLPRIMQWVKQRPHWVGRGIGRGQSPAIPGEGVSRRGLGRRGDRPRLARGV